MTSLEQELAQSGIEQVKPEATILDATSGNRTIWRKRESDNVLWIDIEDELQTKPDIIMDCTNTKFPDKRFHTIFFDPPHGYGKDIGRSWMSLRNNQDKENYPWTPFTGNTYYGWDKYKTKSALLGFIYRAQKEFTRILRDDGLLWVKWDECNIPINKILPFFKNWVEMMRFQININPMVGENPKESKSRSFWFMFMKKSEIIETLDLADFATKEDST